MISILADHNIEGQARLLFRSMASDGWLKLIPLELKTLGSFGLDPDIDDRRLWLFAQEKRLIILTANRNMDGPGSLEQAIRHLGETDSLPVITIGKPDRLGEREYRERCVNRLMEICIDLDDYLGTGRLFLP